MGVSQCHNSNQSWSIAVESIAAYKATRSLGLQVMLEYLSCWTLSVGDGHASRSMDSKTVEQILDWTLCCPALGQPTGIRDPRSAGIYFFEDLSAAALQSPRIQLFSLGILNSMKPSRNPRPEDQRTKYEMAGHIEDKHGVGNACRPNERSKETSKKGFRWKYRSDG